MATKKYDYKSPEFMTQVETLAQRGLNDREIALSLGLSQKYFSQKKNTISDLSDALTRARAQITAVVRQKYLATALGGLKVKTVIRRDGIIIQEVEAELPPNIQALATWLFNHDEEWRQATLASKRMDVTTNGKDVNAVQLVFSPTPLTEKDIEEIRGIQEGSFIEEAM